MIQFDLHLIWYLIMNTTHYNVLDSVFSWSYFIILRKPPKHIVNFLKWIDDSDIQVKFADKAEISTYRSYPVIYYNHTTGLQKKALENFPNFGF